MPHEMAYRIDGRIGRMFIGEWTTEKPLACRPEVCIKTYQG